MFAVMKTGGKQYKVQAGDRLRVEKLAADAGETVQFNDILMLGGDAPVVGSPMVSGAAVQAMVVDQVKGEKLIHFVKRRRKHSSQRKKGHRQQLTLVEITEILPSGGDKSGVKAAMGAGSVAVAEAPAKAAPKKAPAKKAAPKAEAKAEAAPAPLRRQRGRRSQAAVGRGSGAGEEAACRRRHHLRPDRRMDRGGYRRVRRETELQGPDRA
jgi:large subunit ribosomal protein L21